MSPEVIDTPEREEPALETSEVDTPVETHVDIPEEEQPIAQGNQPAAKPLGAEERAIQDGKLAPQAKATLAEIKAKDPQLARQLEKALYQADAIRREFPNGLKDVQQLREQIQSAGGVEGLQRTKQELEYFGKIDEQFTKGDPAFVEALIEDDAGKEAFLKIAPAMVGKWAQLHPDAHAQYIASSFAADLAQEGVPLELEKMAFYLGAGNVEGAQGSLRAIQAYLQRIGGYANKRVEFPKFQPPAQDGREQQLREREQQITLGEWGSERDQDRLGVFNSEWGKLAAGRKLTDTQAAAVKELYVSRLSATVRQIPNFEANLKSYLENGDRAGYLKYLSSIHRQYIPKALGAAMNTILPQKPGPKAGTPALKANPHPALGNPATGATWLPDRPETAKINFAATSSSMIRDGKAVLKDGRTVQWKT